MIGGGREIKAGCSLHKYSPLDIPGACGGEAGRPSRWRVWASVWFQQTCSHPHQEDLLSLSLAAIILGHTRQHCNAPTATPRLSNHPFISTQTVLFSTTGAGDNCCGELMWRRWLGGGCCLSFWRVTHFLWVRIGVKKLFPSFSMFSTSSMLGAGAAVSFLVSTPWRYLYSRSKI